MKNTFINIFAGLFLLISVKVSANEDGLKGKLVDKKGKPVVGAIIHVVGNPEVFTVSDRKGEYRFAIAENTKVVVKTMDYLSKQFTITNEQVTTLNADAESVFNGYNVRGKATSAAEGSVIYADELEKNNSNVHASNALIGQLLGLTVMQNSGAATENMARLNVRGQGAPLVIVDGFERNINDLSVEEIESVTLLKDAASLALYGMRASNGVLVVRTKHGKNSPLDVTFSYDHGIKMAHDPIEMADAYTYASAMNEALGNDGLNPVYNDYQLERYKLADQPLIYSNVNWADEALKNVAHSNSYNLQMRGGNDIAKFYSSIAYDTDKGFVGVDAPEKSIPNQFLYSNLNARTNLEVNLTNTTLMTLGAMGRLQESNEPRYNTSSLMYNIYNTPANAFPVKTENDYWGASNTWQSNPVAHLMTAGFNKYHNRTLNANLGIDQDLGALVKGLKASVRIGFDSYARIREYKYTPYQSEIISTSFDENGQPLEVEYTTIGEKENWEAGRSVVHHRRKMTFQGGLDYQKSFEDAVLGVGYVYDMSTLVGKGQHNTFNRINNVFYASFGYGGKYFLDGTLSVAASNVLEPGDNWGAFPAVSASWLLSEEEFLQNNHLVDYLRLQGSVGIVGSDYMPFDLYKQDYKSGSGVIFGEGGKFNGVSTLRMEGLPVENLTYAKSRNINVGIEALLAGHWNVNLDLFHNYEYDYLISDYFRYSGVLGIDAGQGNNGERSFKGVELGLGYVQNKGDFKYSAQGIFTFTRSKVINANERAWKNDFNKAEGNSVGQIFGFEADGFFVDQTDIDNSPVHTFSEVKPGDIKYKDQDHNGVIDVYDRVAIGNTSAMPELYFSLDLNAEYKGFGMNVLFQGVGSYSTILNTASVYRPLAGNRNIAQHYYDNRWTESNQDALYPRLTTMTNENNNQYSTVWLQDRSYLKLRTAELYYNLPTSLVEKVMIDKARIFVRGYNLLSLDNTEVGDPEALGLDYPLHRSVNVGVKINF